MGLFTQSWGDAILAKVKKKRKENMQKTPLGIDIMCVDSQALDDFFESVDRYQASSQQLKKTLKKLMKSEKESEDR